ncbi:MAG: hypothetical protein ACO1N0_01520 [Fluviicola sp.]
MINKKGKRKIVFNGLTYYWFVKKEDNLDLLSIGSEDKLTLLSYRVDQISDKYIHPKITIIQSEKLIPGIYSFFPPLADEVITNHSVRAILNWHSKQSEALEPLG